MLHHLFSKVNIYLGSSSMETWLYMCGFSGLVLFLLQTIVLAPGRKGVLWKRQGCDPGCACKSLGFCNTPMGLLTTGSDTFLLIFFLGRSIFRRQRAGKSCFEQWLMMFFKYNKRTGEKQLSVKQNDIWMNKLHFKSSGTSSNNEKEGKLLHQMTLNIQSLSF